MKQTTPLFDLVPGDLSASNTDRGVSEIIGFAILFATVLAGIILVYTNGVGSLLQIQYGMQANAGEDVMKVLADDIETLAEQDATSSQSEIELQSVSFGTLSSSEWEITVEDSAGSQILSREFETQELEYVPESKFSYNVPETKFSYSNGAVIRKDNANGLMVHEPMFTIRQNEAYLNFVDLSGTVGSGGQTLATVSFDRTSHELLNNPAAGQQTITIRIETTPTKAKAWERYFEKYTTGGTREAGVQQGARHSVLSGVVEYKFTVDTLVVQKTNVSVEVRN